jgi:outer membrane protein assembly factor BamB
MRSYSTFLSLTVFLALAVPVRTAAQDDSGWHISPTEMNIQVGEPRPLQLLDAHGNEDHTEDWSVDDTDLAQITEEGGRAVLYPKAPGVVNVSASLDGTTRTRKITIWPEASKFRGVQWSVPPIGRETGPLQAVPTGDGPDLFFLDQTDQATYVRAFTHDGLQLWLWRLPEAPGKVEFVCGDDLGGAILAAIRPDSYTLYVVGKDGKALWHRKFAGVRKGHALNYSNTLHVLNQAVDGTWATITALDGATGAEDFSLKIPASEESEINITRSGDKIICAPGRSVTHGLRILTSGLFVNTDGFAYAAFTENDWRVGTDKCAAGSVIDPAKVYFSRDDRLVLWQIHSEGSQKATMVDESRQERASFAAPVTVMSPTGDIIPDGFGGVLLSVRWSHTDIPRKVISSPDEFVYRITEDGEVAYKFPLPKYAGPLHDEMVLGDNSLGFATRGGVLIAFSVEDGREVWRWDSGASEIKINMATAGGGCAVDTREGLVLVEDGVKKRVVAPSGSQMYTPGQYIRTSH